MTLQITKRVLSHPKSFDAEAFKTELFCQIDYVRFAKKDWKYLQVKENQWEAYCIPVSAGALAPLH